MKQAATSISRIIRPKQLILLIAALALLLLIAACGEKQSTNEPGQTQTSTNETSAAQSSGNETAAPADGAALFEQSCATCHGSDLSGGLFGKQANLQTVGARLSKEQIINQIENGSNGMPGFKGQLTEEQIEMLADWLSEKK